jgi:hypothetical protein
VGSHPQIGTPNGSNKADDVHPADASLEEVENDAEGEGDAEAELPEAVGAAEKAARALREKSIGTSHAEDPADVDMKIEQEIQATRTQCLDVFLNLGLCINFNRTSFVNACSVYVTQHFVYGLL